MAFQSKFENIQELRSVIGQKLGTTSWYQITQDQINSFAQLTHDKQWIHISESRSANESPFKKTIAHGYFILSHASRFIHETMSITNADMVINYGLERVRFTKAVKSDDWIRGVVTLKDFEEKPFGGRLDIELIIEIQREVKPACIAEIIFLCYHKSPRSC